MLLIICLQINILASNKLISRFPFDLSTAIVSLKLLQGVLVSSSWNSKWSSDSNFGYILLDHLKPVAYHGSSASGWQRYAFLLTENSHRTTRAGNIVKQNMLRNNFDNYSFTFTLGLIFSCKVLRWSKLQSTPMFWLDEE